MNPYVIDFPSLSPGFQALEGLGKTLQMRSMRKLEEEKQAYELLQKKEQAQKNEEAKQRLMQGVKELESAYKSGDSAKMAELMIKYPELQEKITKVYDQDQKIQQDTEKQAAINILRGGNAEEIMKEMASNNLDRNKNAQEFIDLMLSAQNDDKPSKKWAEMTLSILDPKYMDNMIKKGELEQKIGSAGKKNILEERKVAVAEKRAESYENYNEEMISLRREANAAKAIGDKETRDIKLKELDQKRKQWFVDNDRKQKELRLKAAEQEGNMLNQNQQMQYRKLQMEELKEKDKDRKRKRELAEEKIDIKKRSLVSGIDNQVWKIEDLIKDVENSGISLGFGIKIPTKTGIVGAATGVIPGSPAKILRGNIKSIQSKLAEEEIQKMREMSPTGGALGNVSDKDLELLKTAVANLDPNLGDEELIKQFKEVIRYYNEWREIVTGQYVPPKSGNIIQPPEISQRKEITPENQSIIDRLGGTL